MKRRFPEPSTLIEPLSLPRSKSPGNPYDTHAGAHGMDGFRATRMSLAVPEKL
jgi:hypothetical protein